MANDFLVFGGGAGANVLSQAAYSVLTARSAGFSSGVAQSAQLNKVWRQSSIMAAVLAQFISDRTGLDVLDDGTTATILANLKASAAAVNGDAAKAFSVAAASAATHAVRYDQVMGVGQTLQDLTASRSLTTVYTNTTTKPITLVISVNNGAGQSSNLKINGVDVLLLNNNGSTVTVITGTAIVLPGSTYQLNASGGGVYKWIEIR
ncbi:hypothetical protein SB751_23085 [Cupriavidus sp. SIMBA_020]|uniref:hypothetical protein n=1 Tax=Cupriavidus sp. SIMBA_020 TaxID=3085766 RepID=UPI00397CBB37